ncbi:MAG: Cytidyltransferase-related protein [Candidatus Saccharibacteria bacterium]|nr:Cytidyltransferase-related protein [Candidatus Saccharibacteria bacterium]
MKKVGIYSGTFDPIHNGHLAFAEQAIKACGLDKIFFLTEPRPRRKQGVKAFEHRAHMVGLATRHNPQFGSIVLEQTQFTPHQTLPLLKNRFKHAELYMLMGEDMLKHLADWPHVDELVEAVHLIVGSRQNTPAQVRRALQAINATRGLNFAYTVIDAKHSQLSSSQVKAHLRAGNITADVQPAVADYIHKHHLYASRGDS